MIFLKDHAFSLPPTLPLLLTLVARFGRAEFVKSAHPIGSSTTPESAFPFLTNAAPTTLPVEIV